MNRSRFRRLVLPSIALAALLGVLGLWLYAAGGTGPSALVVAGEARAAESDAELESTRATDDARSAAAESAGPARAAETAVASNVAAALLENGIDVLVVRRGSQQPVAGARVQYAPVGANDEENAGLRWLRRGELDRRLEESGLAFVCDAQGRTRVPRSPAGAVVAASLGDLWGYVTLPRRADPPVRIEVWTDADLVTQVVDAAGAPAGGVRVALRSRVNEEWSNDLASTESRPEDGRAVVRHAGYLMRQSMVNQGKWVAALAELLDPPVEVEIDRDKLPAEPVQLTLPAAGTVEVRIVEWDDQLASGRCDVFLRRLRPDENPAERVDLESGRGISREGVTGGVALFRHVSPGGDLVAWAVRNGHHVPNQARGRGPSAAGLQASITVRMGDDSPVISGRALDTERAPLARQRLGLFVEQEGNEQESGMHGNVTTDELGHFQSDLTQLRPEDGRFSLVVSRMGDGNEELAAARCALPATMLSGRVELGDFVLEPSPVIASGRVVDAAGAPVASATVRAAVKRTWGDPNEFWWQTLWWSQGASDADGRFELRGRVREKQIALQVNKQGLGGLPLIVAVPAHDVELRLESTGEIAGQLLVDASIPLGSVSLNIRRAGTDESRGLDPTVRARAVLGEDGAFLARNLRAGRYEVSLTLRGMNKRSQTISDVVVEAGATTKDPRLNPLDLRGWMRGLRLRVVDDRGEKVPHGTVMFRTTGLPEGRDMRWGQIRAGEAMLVTEGEGLDIDVSVEGFYVHRATNVTTDQDVMMERAPSIELVLAEGLSVPQSPYSLSMSLEPVEPGGRMHSRWSAFDANGRMTVFPPLPGRMRVHLHVQREDEEHGSRSFQMEEEGERILDVQPSGRQTFEITFDPAKLEEAIGKLADAK